MALPELLEALERDAEGKARSLVRDAAREAGTIVAEAREQAAERRRALLDRRLASAREEAARRVDEARAEALRRILEAREAALERVFEAAREELEAALAGDRRDPILERLLAEALACFGDTPVLVRCPPGFQGPVQEAVDRLAAAPGGDRPRAGREIRVVEDPAVAGGVVVTSPDRRLEVDATLPGRLSALRPELAMDVAAHLEEPS